MADAYFAAACVGLLLCLAFVCWRLDRARVTLDTLRAERSEILADVGMLESLLKTARKNDNRDARGRFVSAA